MDYNIKIFINYLKKQHIYVDYEKLSLEIKSHPLFPNLISFSDSLNNLGIENCIVKVDNYETLENFPKRFLTFLKRDEHQMVLVKLSRKNILINKKKTNITELLKSWNSIIFLTESRSKSTYLIKIFKNNFINFLLYFLLIILLLQFLKDKYLNLTFIFFFTTGFIGLFLGVEKLKKELQMNTYIGNKLCSSNPNQTQFDCNPTLNLFKYKSYTFTLTDIVIVFFLSQLTSLLIFHILNFEVTYYIMQCFSISIAFLMCLYSLHYQITIKNKFCSVCIIITTVIFFQLLFILQSFNKFIFSLSEVLLLITIYFFILSSWISHKKALTIMLKLKEDFADCSRFKRNYQVFDLIIKSNTKIKRNSTERAFTFGNIQSNLNLTIIISPFCTYCFDTFQLLRNILLFYEKKTAIFLRFNFNPSIISEETLINNDEAFIHFYLTQLYYEKGASSFLKALDLWFNRNDIKSWKKEHKIDINFSKTKEVLRDQFNWCENNNLTHTPIIIINDFIFPNFYKGSDLMFFMSDLIENSNRDNN
jgi:hypothetical protein